MLSELQCKAVFSGKFQHVSISSKLYPPHLASIIGILAVHRENGEALVVGGDGALRDKQGLARLLALVVGARGAVGTRGLGLHLGDRALWFNRVTGSEKVVAQLLAHKVFSSTTLGF